MLLSLGLFIFELKTLPYDSLKRDTGFNWSAGQRAGNAPAHQFLGIGEDTITLPGVLVPELTGGIKNLAKIRRMAESGKSWILTSGTGESLGRWFITNISEDHSHFLSNGLARRIGFSLTLRRYNLQDGSAKGDLKDSA